MQTIVPSTVYPDIMQVSQQKTITVNIIEQLNVLDTHHSILVFTICTCILKSLNS